MSRETADIAPISEPAKAPGRMAVLWRRFAVWAERVRLIRLLEIFTACAALVMGVLTYVAMTPGATEVSLRQTQLLLLTDLVVLLGLISLVARRATMLWVQRRRGHQASRLHARIDYRNGRYLLSDQSTNGTWVSEAGREPRLVRHDTVDLAGSGTLAFGHMPVPGEPDLVRYILQT